MNEGVHREERARAAESDIQACAIDSFLTGTTARRSVAPVFIESRCLISKMTQIGVILAVGGNPEN